MIVGHNDIDIYESNGISFNMLDHNYLSVLRDCKRSRQARICHRRQRRMKKHCHSHQRRGAKEISSILLLILKKRILFLHARQIIWYVKINISNAVFLFLFFGHKILIIYNGNRTNRSYNN